MSKELKERIQATLDLLWSDGQEDDEDHKAWVIDQVARLLLANGYDEWVRYYEQQDDENVLPRVWDVGVAP